MPRIEIQHGYNEETTTTAYSWTVGQSSTGTPEYTIAVLNMFTKIPSEAGINIVDVAVLALSPVFFGLTYGARRLTHRAIQTTVEKMNTVTASMLVEMREKVCDDIATYHGATAEVLSEGSVDVEYNGDIYPARVTYMNVHGAPKVELLGEPTIVPLLEQDSTEYQKGTSSVKE